MTSAKPKRALCVTAGLDLPSVRVRTGRSRSCRHCYGEDHYPVRTIACRFCVVQVKCCVLGGLYLWLLEVQMKEMCLVLESALRKTERRGVNHTLSHQSAVSCSGVAAITSIRYPSLHCSSHAGSLSSPPAG